MKVKITGVPTKFNKVKPYSGDKYASKKGKAGWNASGMTDEELQQLSEKLGYDGPDDVKSFQKFILNHPDPDIRKKVDQLHSNYGMPNAGQEVDGYWGIRWDVYKDLLKEPEVDPTFDESATETKTGAKPTPGNEFSFTDKGGPKEPYNKRRLPFYQAAPDIAAFVESQNTYNYYTPDFTHWEVSPATMNIQPQLNEINAGANAMYKTTTGNPQIDNIRKQSAFISSLNAKQVAYGQKQNYDANARYNADVQNINARTNEQNLDVQATSRVHNDYRALAKDFATGERLRAVNSLTSKYAKNEANENMKKLWLDNFFPNFTSNGINSIDKTDSDAVFDYNYYPVQDKTNVTNSPFVSPAPINKEESAATKRLREKGIDINNPPINLDPFNDLGELKPIRSNTPSSLLRVPEEDTSMEYDPVRNPRIKPRIR